MELLRSLAWTLLAIAHLPPAAATVAPGLLHRLYGVEPGGTDGMLLQHRGVLFLAVALTAGIAAFDPESRRVASLVVGLSVVGFLMVYGGGGWTAGPLRSIAWVDVALLIPLMFVTYDAWFVESAQVLVDAQLDTRGQ